MSDGSDPRPCEEDRSPGGQPRAASVQRRAATLIPGEGIGTDVMPAMRRVLDAAGASIEWEVVEAGERVRAKGIASGLPWETIDSIQRTGLVARGPLARPTSGLGPTDRLLHQGFDISSQAFRIRSLPGVWTGLGERDLDFWLVRSSQREMEREAEAGLPRGAWPTSAPAGPLDARMFREAFELARREGATSVHCVVRTGQHGLLRVQRMFLAVAEEYAEILSRCVDQYRVAQELIGAPEQFGVIVTSNAVGDVATELASRMAGGLSFLGAMELGPEVVMFAPGHIAGAPQAGRGRASPVGAIRAGVLLLEHIRQEEVARRIERGLAATLERGLGTDEVARARTPVSTREFADAVIAHMDAERRSSPLPPEDRLSARLRRWKVPGKAVPFLR